MAQTLSKMSDSLEIGDLVKCVDKIPASPFTRGQLYKILKHDGQKTIIDDEGRRIQLSMLDMSKFELREEKEAQTLAQLEDQLQVGDIAKCVVTDELLHEFTNGTLYKVVSPLFRVGDKAVFDNCGVERLLRDVNVTKFVIYYKKEDEVKNRKFQPGDKVRRGRDWFMGLDAGVETVDYYMEKDIVMLKETRAQIHESKLTLVPKTWDETTAEEKVEILMARVNGKTIQMLFDNGNWVDVEAPAFTGDFAYRIKPVEPKVVTVVKYFSPDFNEYELTDDKYDSDTHQLSFNKVDGVIDCSSVKLKEL